MSKQTIILTLVVICANLIYGQVMVPKAEKVSPGSWWCYQTTIDIDETPTISHLKIATDTKYWLWINGELVVFEGGLKRGPNPTNSYVDVFENIQGLRKGINTINVLVWYFGKHGFSHKNSGNTGLHFDLRVNNQHFAGNDSWKVFEHPAYYIPVGQKPNYRLAESNIGFDATKDFDSQMTSVVISNPAIKSLNEVNWGKLVERPIPQWKDFGLKNYERIEKRKDTIFAYLPYNAQITPYLKVKAPQGQVIDIRTDNYMGGSAPNVRAEYITRKGIQEYESLGWMNGHVVIYVIPENVEIIELKYRETGYDTEFSGLFKSDNPNLNTLWDKSLRTLYITMRDTYMDCPDRERAQWWGDVVNELGEAIYSLDDKAHLLTKKAILELINWQRSDSSIYSPVPAGNWNQELSQQMLASVGYYGFWTYYMGTGDKETIELVYPHVKKYIKLWKINNEGLVVPRKGGWEWGDWGENIDMELLYNAWYSLALRGFENMALLINKTEDARWAELTNKHLKKRFHEKYWNGKYYRSESHKGEPDDRAQALAIVSNILPIECYPIIRSFFKDYYHASPYMEKYVLEALCRMGYHEDAVERMLKRYNKMIDSPLTTLWEGWGIGKEGYGGGTYNHAWSGGTLTIMSEFLAGISPISPAFTKFRVAPSLPHLNEIHCIVPTINGSIKIDVSMSTKLYLLQLQVPTHTQAELNIPLGYKTYKLNNKRISLNKIKKQFYKISLTSGDWRLEASMK
ncbi:MAG: alpha-L-rhamnosidase C-terminal domain-containing protein [Lentimicrobium sp.]|jgi:hypothetical protein|nr:alpha-L-rhamnosidase C-terminal domain-containing protein [Lentimicrobium sp.]